VLMSCCSSFWSIGSLIIGSGEVLPHQLAGELLPDPEGPGERPASHGEFVAPGRRVQVRPSARSGGGGIWYDSRTTIGARTDHHAQQLTLRSPLTAPDARPDRTCRRVDRCANHWTNPTPSDHQDRTGPRRPSWSGVLPPVPRDPAALPL